MKTEIRNSEDLLHKNVNFCYFYSKICSKTVYRLFLLFQLRWNVDF